MKAGLYARVSTDHQQTENQLIELRRFCNARNYEIEEFIEEPISGKYGEEKRPKLRAIMEAARRRQIDLVVTWDLSRFARSIKQLVDAIENLKIWNVGFTTIRENIDTTTANGRLVFHIFSGLAEFERELICERTRLGLRRAVANGKRLGRPRVQVDAQLIAELSQRGMSLRQIEAQTGFNRMTISRALSQNGSSKTVPIIVGSRNRKSSVTESVV